MGGLAVAGFEEEGRRSSAQGCGQPREIGKGQKQILSWSFQKECTSRLSSVRPTADFDLQNWNIMNLCCVNAPSLRGPVRAAIENGFILLSRCVSPAANQPRCWVFVVVLCDRYRSDVCRVSLGHRVAGPQGGRVAGSQGCRVTGSQGVSSALARRTFPCP